MYRYIQIPANIMQSNFKSKRQSEPFQKSIIKNY